MIEFIFLHNHDEIIEFLKVCYCQFVQDNFSDYPGDPVSFKSYVEEVISTAIDGDREKMDVHYCLNDDDFIEDIVESLANSNILKLEKSVFVVSYIASMTSIIIERVEVKREL